MADSIADKIKEQHTAILKANSSGELRIYLQKTVDLLADNQSEIFFIAQGAEDSKAFIIGLSKLQACLDLIIGMLKFSLSDGSFYFIQKEAFTMIEALLDAMKNTTPHNVFSDGGR